jgi:aryl-alcohol dehydrogenase-like predicted oxidoreductase
MKKRQLGRSNLQIAPLVFGGNIFGWTVDEPTSHRLLDAFVDGGFNAIDTANVYSTWVPGHQGGESEAIVGNWLKQRKSRQKIIIATKVGKKMGDGSKGLSKANIVKSAEESLRRLRTDYIDLYQSHADDETVDQTESLEAYLSLIGQGKVRVIGASNFTAARLSGALDRSVQESLPRYESMRPCYNLYDRWEYEGDLQDVCVKRRVGVICYFSLASGFLTGKYRSKLDLQGKIRGEDVEQYLDPRGQRILRALDQVAERHAAKPAQIALAWLLTRPGITAPIASATNLDQLAQLTGAARLNLNEDSLRELTEASDPN